MQTDPILPMSSCPHIAWHRIPMSLPCLSRWPSLLSWTLGLSEYSNARHLFIDCQLHHLSFVCTPYPQVQIAGFLFSGSGSTRFRRHVFRPPDMSMPMSMMTTVDYPSGPVIINHDQIAQAAILSILPILTNQTQRTMCPDVTLSSLILRMSRLHTHPLPLMPFDSLIPT